MEILLLGSMIVRDGHDTIDITAPRHRVVVVTLAVAVGQWVSKERLTAVLSDKHDVSPGLVRSYISTLRRVFPRGSIETTSGNHRLKGEAGDVDLHRFQKVLDEAKAAEGAARARKLNTALALWRGPALMDVDSDYLLRAVAEPYEEKEKRITAREDLCEVSIRQGGHRHVIGELKQLLADNPYREHIYELLMLALYRTGRQAEALALYQTLRRRLSDERALVPTSRLQELHRRLLSADPSLNPQPDSAVRDERGALGPADGKALAGPEVDQGPMSLPGTSLLS